MNLLIISLVSYLLGTFPTSLLVVKLFIGKDVRASGSGNAGGLNTLRLVTKHKNIWWGLFAFVIVLLVDIFKAILAVYLTRFVFMQDNILGITLAAFFAVLGHNYPFYLNFYGGRGAACLIGILLYLDWKILIPWMLTIVIFMILGELMFVILLKKKLTKKFIFAAVSDQILGRLIGEAAALVPIYFLNRNLFFPALAGTLLIIIRHKERLAKQFIEFKKA